MKRYRRVYILLGVLAAACVATFAVMRLEERQEQIQTSGETVLELSGEEVEALSWDYEGETLSFHRPGGVALGRGRGVSGGPGEDRAASGTLFRLWSGL